MGGLSDSSDDFIYGYGNYSIPFVVMVSVKGAILWANEYDN